MSPERLEQIQSLYLAALDLPLGERNTFLNEACADDADLHREVASLLEASADENTFLDHPLADVRILEDNQATIQQPSRVGPYRIVEEIGRGGMGTVYLAARDDGQFEQQVALKVIRRGFDTDDIIRRFLQERQILARLQHPHIARLYDGGVDDQERPYFALEYIEGEPLTAYCDRHELPIDARLRLFQKVGEAVQYAHSNLIVHRDLKPSNMLVDAQGQVKLLDFGIAKVLEEEAPDLRLTHTGARVLTPEYAAPEQLLGKAITTSTDIYALGVVLYELLTGHRPYHFERATPGAVEQAVLQTEPQRPSTIVTKSIERHSSNGTTEILTPAQVSRARRTQPASLKRHLSGDLDTMILKTLKKEPAHRYASAEALVEDIRRYLSGQPVQAQPDTASYRLRKFTQRHRLGVTAAALVVLALATGMTLALWQARVAAQERDRVRLEANKATEVKDFLIEVFRVSDPSESRGRSVTALELLNTGATRIENELHAQPAIRAELMGVIGEVYQQLGLYEEGAALASQSLALHETLALSTEDKATALHRLALIRYDQGHIEKAQALLREALHLREAQPSPDDKAIASTQHHLGVLLLENGDLAAADSLLRHALAAREHLGTEIDLAETQASLGLLLIDQGRYAEAETRLKTALETQRRLLGEDHPDVGETMHGLAQSYWYSDDLEAAEPLFRSVLALSRKLYSADHSYIALDLNSLGLLLMDKGEHEEAERLYLEALSLQKAALGTEHPDASATIYNLGSCYMLMERYSEAETLLRQAIELDLHLFGEDHPNVAIDRSRLAAVLRAQGHYKEALDLLDRADPVFRATFDATHHRIASVQIRRAQVAYDQQRYEEAASLLRSALQKVGPVWAPHSWKIAEAQGYLGLSLLHTGLEKEGRTLLRHTLPVLDNRLGSTHSLTQQVKQAIDA